MPQIKQLQSVYWGPFRPDPIELATDGINVFAGMNGVGKTCLLDAIKLLLGIDDLKAKPADYIYSSDDESQRVDKAYVKGVFGNPIRSRQQGRVFADAGWGCAESENVTAVCEVTRTGRRYAIFPGYLAWGVERPLAEDLAALRDLPNSRWLGPRQWSELLARAGVSRALLSVIALRQGETDKALGANPEQLLRQMLELTGKQQTLDDFRAAKANLAEARRRYDEVLDRFASEERELTRLGQLVQRHKEFQRDERRVARIDEVELPLARRRKIEAELRESRSERDQRAGQLETARADRVGLDAEMPALEQRQRELLRERETLQANRHEADTQHSRALATIGRLEGEIERARAALAVAEPYGEPTSEALVQREAEAHQAMRALDHAHGEHARLERELAELRAGRVPRPSALDDFQALLEERGIDSVLLAERLEVPAALAAEAVLSDGAWALIVATDQFDEAVRLAREHAYRLPIVRAGPGLPGGVFAGADGLDEASAYLAEIELPLGEVPGVEEDGLVRGRNWAALRAPEQAVLGEAARLAGIERRDGRRGALAEEIRALAAAAESAAEVARGVRAALEAQAALPSLLPRLEQAKAQQTRAETARTAAQERLDMLGPELGQLETELVHKREESKNVDARLEDLEPRVKRLTERVGELERELEEMPLTAEQEAIENVPGVEVLQSQRADLQERLLRFSEQERSPLVVAEHAEQRLRVDEVRVLVEDRKDVLDGMVEQVERAKRRYDEHINQTVQNLNRAFKEICGQAGMDGELERRPSLTVEGEWALDVRVAHREGEPKLSYQHHKHSGGQKAKISILLLLAAMSAEGAADLLIVDEHSAHLDSENIEYVGEVMRALRERVQFVLALPATAEARRIDWSDQQFAILPRPAGENYVPPLQLITRMPEPGDRYAEIGQLDLAG